jgi:hypothetical protein
MTTRTKAKPKGWLTTAKEALIGTPHLDWAALQASADQALDDAKEHHARCAYNAQVELPGSSEALIRANEALQAAQAKLVTVKAAREEYERQQAQQRRDARAAEIAKQDKAALAAFKVLADKAAEGEAKIKAFVLWWDELEEADRAARQHFDVNERLRNDLRYHSLPDLVSKDMGRIAAVTLDPATPYPPGVNHLAVQASDPREWPTLADYFADLAKAVLV